MIRFSSGVIAEIGRALFRRGFFCLASRSLRRRLLGQRKALSLFPSSCASFSVVSAFAVSHKRQLSPDCRAVATGRNRGRRPRGCCRGVRFATCGAVSCTLVGRSCRAPADDEVPWSPARTRPTSRGVVISNVRKSGARSITSLAADLNMFPRFAATDATSTRIPCRRSLVAR